MPAELGRAQRLAGRVRWLDRYRRPIATVIGLAVTLMVITGLYDRASPAWSRFYSIMLGLVLGVFTWVALEVVFAWFSAFWETEATHISRHPGLPRATLRRPKRKPATTDVAAGADPQGESD